MSIEKKLFGKYGYDDVYSYTMTNKNGCSVTILSYGGIINKIVVPDRNGKMGDIACGFDKVEDYVADSDSYTGAIVGRVGNRIAGNFMLDGKEIRIADNVLPGVHMHGGNVGFNRKMWYVDPTEGEGSDSLLLRYFSPDMEEGYPGNLYVRVTYTFDDDNALTIHYEADTDKKTYINLTNHVYFNLNGYDGCSAMEQELMLNADYYDKLDERLVPYKEPQTVDGTVFDFRKPKKIGIGFDNNFHLNGEGFRLCGTAYDEKSGRTLEMYTDLKGVQLYTAVEMAGPVNFKGNVPQKPLYAFCLETQNAPDLPNRPNLPQLFTEAGETYVTTTKFVFGTK
ncbi:MAG: galactose mutarotase [Firmicutes bacterium]|nr:galactose mutarotase [Candidatus Colimorpha enterica]